MSRFMKLHHIMTVAAGWMLAAAALAAEPAAQHAHKAGPSAPGKALELGTSVAADEHGRLWAVLKETVHEHQFLSLQVSSDMGQTWSPPRKILREPVAARGEERPKIAFGPKGEVYIAYTKPVAKPHIGEIRFIRSVDGGRTFSRPITVHADRQVITHAFGSMIVDRKGRVYVAWLDGRDKEQAKALQKPYPGNALYYAVSTDGGASFQGDHKVADHTCECCRIGLTLNPQGGPVAFWRHIFAPNIRDHALAEMTPSGVAKSSMRATFDDWRVDACPHHGPSIAYAPNGVRHQVWFNGKEGDGGGVLYAATDASGALRSPAVLGSAQAAHADIVARGEQMAIAWKQFDGRATALYGRLSYDGGASWSEQQLASTTGDSDKPHLVRTPTGIVLVWRTQNEGIRVMPFAKEKS